MAVRFPLQSRWWRFDEYKVTQGYIMPSPGAELVEYDPFDLYRATWDRDGKAKRKSLGNHPAYVELMHILNRSGDHAVIERWCGKYGLLGLLQFRIIRLVHGTDDAMQVIESPQRRDVSMELDEMIMDSLARPTRALVFTRAGDIEDRSPVETLVPYFPHLEVSKFSTDHLLWGLGAHGYPDKEVLRHSVEPVSEFIEAAGQLREAFRTLTQAENHRPPDWASQVLPPDYIRALGCAWEDLAWADGTWQPRWRFTSLLAALYTMMRLDVGGGKLMRYCKRVRCGKPFITDDVQQEYCSIQCARAEEKARERARKRWFTKGVQTEFQRIVAALEQRYPDADPGQLRVPLHRAGGKVINNLVGEAKRQFPSCYEQALYERVCEMWESAIIRKYGQDPSV